MNLYQNEHKELYNPDDFESQRFMKLSYGRKLRKLKPKPDGRTCKFCGNALQEGARANRLYCTDQCRQRMRKLRGK